MSIVLAVATPDVAIIKCDGRKLKGNKEILSEDEQKFQTVGKSCIVGYAGDAIFIYAVVKKAVDICAELGYSEETITVSIFSKICHKVLISSGDAIRDLNNPIVNLVIIGIEGGLICMKAIDSKTGFTIRDASPQAGQNFKVCSLLSEAGEKGIGFLDFFNPMISTKDNMDNYIKYISTIDFSVNTNISTAILKRKEE